MGKLPLRIDIVSDVVCPWCVIGYKQLERALSEASIMADIHWHPFELNLHMAEEGENLRDHVIAKYGTTREDSIKARAMLTKLGAELGFTFNYTDDLRMHNTFRSHQLLHWANQLENKHDLELALFEAFFTHRKNVNDPDVLAKTAGEIGLDRDEAARVLASREFADAVRDEEQFWISKGISGVPAMIFNKTHLVTGARGVENYAEVLRHIVDSEAA